MIAVNIVAGVIRFDPYTSLSRTCRRSAQRLPQLTEQAPQTTLSSAGDTASFTAAAALLNRKVMKAHRRQAPVSLLRWI
jgi:hypothetical protein